MIRLLYHHQTTYCTRCCTIVQFDWLYHLTVVNFPGLDVRFASELVWMLSLWKRLVMTQSLIVMWMPPLRLQLAPLLPPCLPLVCPSKDTKWEGKKLIFKLEKLHVESTSIHSVTCFFGSSVPGIPFCASRTNHTVLLFLKLLLSFLYFGLFTTRWDLRQSLKVVCPQGTSMWVCLRVAWIHHWQIGLSYWSPQMGWWGDMGGPKQKGIVQYCKCG